MFLNGQIWEYFLVSIPPGCEDMVHAVSCNFMHVDFCVVEYVVLLFAATRAAKL